MTSDTTDFIVGLQKQVRLGNLVEVTGPLAVPSQGIHPVTIEMMEIMQQGSTSYYPVRLTEDWLLKFGFEFRNEVRGDGALLDFKNENWKRSMCVGKIYDRPGFTHLGSDRVDIQWVHQLQNLYFAIVGEEIPYKL